MRRTDSIHERSNLKKQEGLAQTTEGQPSIKIGKTNSKQKNLS